MRSLFPPVHDDLEDRDPDHVRKWLPFLWLMASLYYVNSQPMRRRNDDDAKGRVHKRTDGQNGGRPGASRQRAATAERPSRPVHWSVGGGGRHRGRWRIATCESGSRRTTVHAADGGADGLTRPLHPTATERRRGTRTAGALAAPSVRPAAIVAPRVTGKR